VHIKETFAARMADVLQDAVEFTTIKEEKNNVVLYQCMKDAKKFMHKIDLKLKRGKKSTHDSLIKQKALRPYLTDLVPKIADVMKFTVVTDFGKDHLLTVTQDDAKFTFVYFGAMNEELTYVACWLRIPLGLDKKPKTVEEQRPNIFFWVVHSQYTQALEGLGEAEGVHLHELEKIVNFKESINYV
jgi:hypothetical protein